MSLESTPSQRHESREMTDVESRLLVCCSCGDLLRQPLLLDCLHSCCTNCVLACKVGDDSVKCPACMDTMPATAAKNNDFVAAKVAAFRLEVMASVCSFCPDEGKGERPAAKWCSLCDVFLCRDCLQWHDRFKKHPDAIVDVGQKKDSRQQQQLPPKLCPVHASSYDFFCTNCACLKCSICVKKCVASNHVMDVARGSLSGDFRTRLISKVQSARDTLGSRLPPLRRQAADIVSELNAAKAADLARLTDNKQTALDSVCKAYDTTTNDLEAIYQGLIAEAAQLQLEAKALDAKASQVLTYWDELSTSNDMASLVDQHEVVLARLSSLDLAVAGLPPNLNRNDWTMICREQPGNIDDLVKAWMGSPKELKGSLEDRLRRGVSNNSQQNEPPPDAEAKDGDTASCGSSADEPVSVQISTDNALHLCAATLSFDVPADCRDVACTADGRILVAALKSGLLQFDAASGKKLKTWTPTTRWNGTGGCINTVDVLGDGRLVVGDASDNRATLLERHADGETWQDCKRVMLDFGPWSLAALGDRIAVSEARIVRKQEQMTNWGAVVNTECSPGPHLSLHSLVNGKKLFTKKLDYGIVCVSLVTDHVICASQFELTKYDGTDQCFVDCFDYNGRLVWRHNSRELVADIFPVPSANVIYLALPCSVLVIAINVTDGQALTDVLSERHGLAHPRVLSLCSTGKRMAVAVLSYVNDKITLFPLSA